MPVQPYLFLNGSCQEAIDFYTQVLRAELLMQMRFKDAPEGTMSPPDADGESIMHACLRVGGSEIFLSDGMGAGQPRDFQGFYLSLLQTDDAAAQRAYEALGQGGTVIMPLSETFFATSFALLKDRFGVPWMIIVQK